MLCISYLNTYDPSPGTCQALLSKLNQNGKQDGMGWDDDLLRKGGPDGHLYNFVEAALQGKTSVVKELINSCNTL